MPKIQRIDVRNPIKRDNIKNMLGYVVKKRSGHYDSLRYIDNYSGETIDKLVMAGLIQKEDSLKKETYNITDLGDRYYSDVFGKFSYWKKRLTGIAERFLKRHL